VQAKNPQQDSVQTTRLCTRGVFAITISGAWSYMVMPISSAAAVPSARARSL
jgi:hypothetical protein